MTPCPPDARLRAFDRGGVPDAELDAITAHLGVCLGCVDRLARLAVAVGPLGPASDPAPDHSALCEPSQNGAFFVCLQPHR